MDVRNVNVSTETTINNFTIFAYFHEVPKQKNFVSFINLRNFNELTA